MARSASTMACFLRTAALSALSLASGEAGGQSQAPGVEWEVELGDRMPSRDSSILPLGDGGFVFLAERAAGPHLVQLDPSGSVVWERKLEARGHFDSCGSPEPLAASADGGYLVAGRTIGQHPSNVSSIDAYIVKLDSEARVVWDATHGGPRDEFVAAIHEAGDGGCLVAGTANTSDNVALGYDVFLVKFSPQGTFEWEKTFGRKASNNFGRGVQWAEDDSCTVAALSYAWGGGPSIYLFKTDGEGNLLWERTLPSEGYSPWLRQDAGGTLILVDAYAIWRLGPDGRPVWRKNYAALGPNIAESVEATADGGHLITGYTIPSDALGWDAQVVKTTQEGDVLWRTSFSRTGDEQAFSGRETPDGGYLIWAKPVSGGTTRLLKLAAPIEAAFRRGDANADGKLDIADPVSALNYLYLGGRGGSCFDAVDANDDGLLNVTDAIISLIHLFSGQVSLSAPGPYTCGPDPTEDRLAPCAYAPAGCPGP